MPTSDEILRGNYENQMYTLHTSEKCRDCDVKLGTVYEVTWGSCEVCVLRSVHEEESKVQLINDGK